MAKDAMGDGGADQDQDQDQTAGMGQHGLIHGDSEVTEVGTQGQSGQRNSDTLDTRQQTGATEPIRGKRNRVKTAHFWNR